jgi:hypothetical protein
MKAAGIRRKAEITSTSEWLRLNSHRRCWGKSRTRLSFVMVSSLPGEPEAPELTDELLEVGHDKRGEALAAVADDAGLRHAKVRHQAGFEIRAGDILSAR